jgi:hypothetical protein
MELILKIVILSVILSLSAAQRPLQTNKPDYYPTATCNNGGQPPFCCTNGAFNSQCRPKNKMELKEEQDFLKYAATYPTIITA